MLSRGAALPLSYLLMDSIGHLGDQDWGDLCPIHLLEGRYDISSTHSLGVEGQDLIIELSQAGAYLRFSVQKSRHGLWEW